MVVEKKSNSSQSSKSDDFKNLKDAKAKKRQKYLALKVRPWKREPTVYNLVNGGKVTFSTWTSDATQKDMKTVILNSLRCPICKHRFDDSESMKKHALKHSDTPFICPNSACEVGFKTALELDVHKLKHDDFEPYRCTYQGCNKVFALEYTLTAHLRAHTGEKPYRCPLCHVCFAQVFDLHTHMLIHDPNELNNYEQLDVSALLSLSFLNDPVAILKRQRAKEAARAAGGQGQSKNMLNGAGSTSMSGQALATNGNVVVSDDANNKNSTTLAGSAGSKRSASSRRRNRKKKVRLDKFGNIKAPRVRRRPDQIVRNFICSVENCGKAYGSPQALHQHKRIKHPFLLSV